MQTYYYKVCCFTLTSKIYEVKRTHMSVMKYDLELVRVCFRVFSGIDLKRGPWNDLPKAVPRPAEKARQEGGCIMFHLCALPEIETEPHAAMRPKKWRTDQLVETKRRANEQSHLSTLLQQTRLVLRKSSLFVIICRQGYSPPCTPPFVNSFSLIKSLLLGEHFYWLCCP